ncbi:MFS transporter [Paenibacillus sp. FSL R7-0333]|uniref:MFS transporter n=1 Tax=Paenibacillus sp. FSL R7-0333 TaxID=1926587 RepID=UPI00096DDC7B|nr:MFS transporter [Paenibacillus sp. FSL R7-0333]
MKELLRNRVFLLVMASDVLQQVGIWVRNMALLYYVVQQTQGDPVAVSLLTVVEYAPIFLFSLVGGVLADRWRPKRTMIWGDVLSFLSIVPILFVVAWGYWQAVFIVTMISAIVSQFSQPSSAKLLKTHVPEQELTAAMAMTQMVSSLFIILGPILGTFVYYTFGVMVSLSSLLVIFALSACFLLFLPDSPRSMERLSVQAVVNDLRGGLLYLLEHANLKVLMVMFGVLALGAGLTAPLDIFLVTERLGLAEADLQWFTALSGLGLLIGAIIAASLSGRLKGKGVVFAGLILLGAGTMIEVWSVWPILTGGMRLITGLFLALTQTVIGTYMLTLVRAEYIGRINGLITPIFTGCTLIGTGLSGMLVAQSSLIFVYMLSGLILMLAALVALRLRFDYPVAKQAEGVETAEK